MKSRDRRRKARRKESKGLKQEDSYNLSLGPAQAADLIGFVAVYFQDKNAPSFGGRDGWAVFTNLLLDQLEKDGYFDKDGGHTEKFSAYIKAQTGQTWP